MRTLEVLDWSVIVRYVLSFLCIVLSYNAISGERESGTLRLAFANPVSRGQFLMGKFLAHLLTLTVTLTLGSLISLAILALSGVLELNGLVARSYLFFLAGAVFFAALFLLLGLGIFLAMTVFATKDAVFSFQINDYTMGVIAYPKWPSKFVIPVGTMLISLRLFNQLIEQVTGLTRHSQR